MVAEYLSSLHNIALFISRPKPIKKSRTEKAKKTDTTTEKKRETPVFILPKQSGQICLPIESHSVELQTELARSQFTISKPSLPLSCQAVQTSCQSVPGDVQTAANHTVPHFQCPSEKISMGIQTIVLVPPSEQSGSQIQTTDRVGKSSITNAAKAPKVKINKSTQKSPFKKRLRLNVMKLSSSSQTSSPSHLKKPDLGVKTASSPFTTSSPNFWDTNVLTPLETDEEKSKPPRLKQQPELDSSVEEFLTSMSTQTDLSCLLNQLLPDPQKHDSPGLPNLHGSHTQTSFNECHQFIPQGSQNPLNNILQNENLSFPALEQQIDNHKLQKSNQMFVPMSNNFENKSIQTKMNGSKSIHSQTSSDLPCHKQAIPNLEEALDYGQNKLCDSNNYFIPFGYQQENTHWGQSVDLNLLSNQHRANQTLQVKSTTKTIMCDKVQSSICSGSQTIALTDNHEHDPVFPERILKSSAVQTQPGTIEKATIVATREDEDTQTFNDFAWDMGTQTFDNIMWEMGTQTVADLVMEIGTQTLADFTPSKTVNTEALDIGTQTITDIAVLQRDDNLMLEKQTAAHRNRETLEEPMEDQSLEIGTHAIANIRLGIVENQGLKREPQLKAGTITSQSLTYPGLQIGTQAKNDSTVSHETAAMRWETASKPVDILKMHDMVTQIREETLETEKRVTADISDETNFQAFKCLHMETGAQTMPLSQTSDYLIVDMEAEATPLPAVNDASLEIRTQTMADIRSLPIEDHLGLDMGTQTIADLTYSSTMDNVSLDIGTQTMAGIPSLTTQDNLGLDMEMQTMADTSHMSKLNSLFLEMGTQTIENIPTLSTLDTIGLEMETQTIADVTCIPNVDNLCLEMGTQTLGKPISHFSTTQYFGLETATQTGNDVVLDMETQTATDMANLHSINDIDMIIGTQTVSDDAWRTVQQIDDGRDPQMRTQSMADFTALQAESCPNFEIGTQTMVDITALQVGDSPNFETGMQTMADMTALQFGNGPNFEMGTQTMADVTVLNGPNFEMGTQTMADLTALQFGDEEDLLEFLTRETQTQTGDDLLEFLTRETQTQTPTTTETCGDERAVQTEDLLEFFTTATQTQVMEVFSHSTSMNHVQVGTGDDLLEFLTRESETQTQANL
ncbi:hypothetical protein ElyMa_002245200 [Elysia marginata]|uniref:Uncharacterized protein n=1 Tax=Elysia marginata TaxID=1093978 RepID=A0AAV4FWI3_9GAST|nr:hypothetical protein ElyMa_002245200 [Elysia marginata]